MNNLNSVKTIIILASLVAFAPVSTDMYLPAMPVIANDLNTQDNLVQLTITVFLAGISLGMLIYGPLSDYFGRRKLLLSGIVFYIISSVICIFVNNIYLLILFRFLQSLGGAAASVLARAIVRDLFPMNKVASVLSWMHIVTMIATIISPIFGSQILLFSNWRAIFITLTVLSIIALYFTWNKIPETLNENNKSNSIKQAFKNYYEIIKNRQALSYILCMGLTFGGMFVYIALSSFIFIDYFKLTPQNYALLFSLNILGVMAFTFLNTRLLKKYLPNQLIKLGASMTALSGLFLLIFIKDINLIILVSLIFVYVSVTGMVGANAIGSLLNLYPDKAGAASGLATSFQFGSGMFLSGIASIFSDGSPVILCIFMGFTGIGALLVLRLSK